MELEDQITMESLKLPTNHTALDVLAALCHELSMISEKKEQENSKIMTDCGVNPPSDVVVGSFSTDLKNYYLMSFNNNNAIHVPKRKRSAKNNRTATGDHMHHHHLATLEIKNSEKGQDGNCNKKKVWSSVDSVQDSTFLVTPSQEIKNTEEEEEEIKKSEKGQDGNDKNKRKRSSADDVIVQERDEKKKSSKLGHQKIKRPKVKFNIDNCPPMPTDFKNHLTFLNGGVAVGKEILVIQKYLEKSDISKQQNRLSIPLSKMMSKFLTDAEENHLLLRDNMQHVNKIDVTLLDPWMENWSVTLRRWIMTKKDPNKFSTSFVINGPNWIELVQKKGLQAGDLIQLWAVRGGVGDQNTLSFALVKLPSNHLSVNG